MWSQLLLCCLVGFVAASDNGWKSNTEYMYKVHGRTLTGLHEVADQYSGVLIKANLIVRPQADGKLMAKLADAKYAQVHANLPEGWKSDIPEGKLNYQQLPLSEQPFQVVLKNGVVRDLIVSKQVQNWEANILKSVVSQIQLDTQGEHVIKSHVNQLPEEHSNSATFKTMEDTVTGKYETMYDITPLPEYLLQSQPWIAPMPQMKGDGELIEIVKSKNFSRGEERVGYHFGLGENKDWEPSSNQMGEFFSRSSISRAIISGNLRRYTIQSSSTTNKIVVRPTLNSEQKGMVVSHLNLTLSHVQQSSSQFPEIQQPQHLGSLVYRYNTPFSGSQEARPGHQRREQEDYEYSSEEQEREQRHFRHRRAALSEEQEYASAESEDKWTQEQPKLHQAPESPLLPMFIGYKGKSIKSSEKVDVPQTIQKIAQEIAHELQRPENMPKEHTLAKFTIITRLVRLLNEKEMKQVAHQLYSQGKQGSESDAWKVYRDAVAQSGTGPALLTVQEWIESKKIRGEEAAELVARMADSARQPTEEYMRAFYALATKEEVKSQATLNDTVIISFASLVRKVYVDKYYSDNQYPVQSFGSFRHSENAKRFVLEEFIPYLKQKLNQAIEHADSHKALVYIRALGNVAHQKVLAAFEPYLEGQKQASQFQRLQMVLALDKLTQVHPKIARSVLYKIYQNAGEEEQVRVAAVFQLMRTSPPADMLQRMAQYTNVDTAEQVNAAVKSTIEAYAQMESEQYSDLIKNARTAESLLTQETYGVQYSRNYLRDYVVEQMKFWSKQELQTFGSEDSFVPRGIKYMIGVQLGGVSRKVVDVEAMVSSIDELTNVLAQQTEQHQQKQHQQKQGYEGAQQNQWSSEHIAKLLKIETDEREQLEGSLLLQLASGSTRYFTFNNHTVQMLPHALRQLEDALRQGQEFHLSKFYSRRAMEISFPTEMALPFVYNLDIPSVMHVKGQIRASAEPKISSGDKIHKPHTIQAQGEIRAVLSSNVQAKLGFVTPFDHQKYVSGVEKISQVYIPIKSEIELDIKNKQMRAQLQAAQPEKDVEIYHHEIKPFTAKKDLLDLQPTLKSEHAHVIRRQSSRHTEFQRVFGKQTGMALRVEFNSEQKFLDSYWAYEQLRRHDGLSALMAHCFDETIQYSKIKVEYAGSESTARKVQLKLGYESRREQEQSNESNANVDIQQFQQLPKESKARQQQFAKMAAAGVRNAEVQVVDVAVEFQGQDKVEYTATAAIASSPADEKARFLMYVKKHSANQHESKPYEIALLAKARIPNTNGLDFVHALKFDPTTTVQAELAFGQDIQSGTKVNMHAKLEQSESRKRYLQSHPRARECRDEMQQGNHQIDACANMTVEANLLDRVQVQLQFDNVSPKARNMTNKLHNALRYFGYYNLDENMVNAHGNGKQNQIDLEARFDVDFESVNITMKTEKMESALRNVRVNDWVKPVVAVHPVFHPYSQMMGKIFDYDTVRPICVVDQSAASTLDNKTYPISLGQSWTVMLQYVPTFARQHQQERNYQQQQKDLQAEQYVVLVRQSQSEKEIKMTIRTPETQGQDIEIQLQGDSQYPKVSVNKKEQHLSEERTTELHGGFIQMYRLPNNEVKIEVRSAFYIIFDGKRVKLSATHDKLRDSVRGLCGTYDGQESSDFRAPENCLLREPRDFVAAWTLDKQQQQRHQRGECQEEETVYANVISDYDAGRSHQKYQRGSSSGSQHRQHASEDRCTKQQTRYIVQESDDAICFTIHPVAACKSSCESRGTTRKSMPVHCVQNSNVAQLWKKQIQKGASPDFSQKEATKHLMIEVPTHCSQ